MIVPVVFGAARRMVRGVGELRHRFRAPRPAAGAASDTRFSRSGNRTAAQRANSSCCVWRPLATRSSPQRRRARRRPLLRPRRTPGSRARRDRSRPASGSERLSSSPSAWPAPPDASPGWAAPSRIRGAFGFVGRSPSPMGVGWVDTAAHVQKCRDFRRLEARCLGICGAVTWRRARAS
jgi:hypothetical protein